MFGTSAVFVAQFLALSYSINWSTDDGIALTGAGVIEIEESNIVKSNNAITITGKNKSLTCSGFRSML